MIVESLENGAPSVIIRNVTEALAEDVSRTIYGHERIITMVAGAFLIGGHVLLEGPPGIAKTLLARSFARALGLRFKRIQFTPDLMPSDVTGVYVFDPKNLTFHLSPGPVFADIVLADEINRTPPKTQAALLEAMQERRVTIDGKQHLLGELFFVLATQNPIEHEGTFPLPEAQLDRFLFKLRMGYPPPEVEQAMVCRFSSELPVYAEENGSELNPLVTNNSLQEARAAIRKIVIEAAVADYIQRIITQTRQHDQVLIGASSRAAVNLALAAKFQAALSGRDFVIPDDVKASALDVLAHRIIVKPEHYDLDGGADKIVAEILQAVSVPR